MKCGAGGTDHNAVCHHKDILMCFPNFSQINGVCGEEERKTGPLSKETACSWQEDMTDEETGTGTR